MQQTHEGGEDTASPSISIFPVSRANSCDLTGLRGKRVPYTSIPRPGTARYLQGLYHR